MSDECRYYYYEGGYCCALKREKEGYSYSSVDSDDVHKYCWGYHYEGCPTYKKYCTSSGGCYITSACVEAKGMPDNCRQLETLRNFRDTYLKNTENGDKEIAEYYLIAPTVVKKIKSFSNSKQIFGKIYSELVEPCVALIEQGKNEDAHVLYRTYTKHLYEKFCIIGGI